MRLTKNSMTSSDPFNEVAELFDEVRDVVVDFGKDANATITVNSARETPGVTEVLSIVTDEGFRMVPVTELDRRHEDFQSSRSLSVVGHLREADPSLPPGAGEDFRMKPSRFRPRAGDAGDDNGRVGSLAGGDNMLYPSATSHV
jgi:hypothetical protein